MIWLSLFIYSFVGTSQTDLLNPKLTPDSLFTKYKSEANSYQRKGRYKALDSISQLIIALGESENNQNFVHQGYYFKANYLSQSDPQGAIDYAEKALNYFQNIGDLSKASRIANSLGINISKTGKNKKAIEVYKRAIRLSEKSKEGSKKKEELFRASIMTNIAGANLNYGEYDDAASYIYQSLEIGERYKDTLMLYSNSNLLGHIKLITKDYQDAILYYKKALEYIIPLRPSSATYVMSGLANAHVRLKQIDSALYYFEQIIPAARKSSDYVTLNRNLNNVTLFYIQEEQYEKAIETAHELLEVSGRLNNKNSKLDAYLNLAKIHKLREDYNLAKTNIDKAIAILDDDDELGVTSQIHNQASEIYEKLGLYQLALRHQKMHKTFADSIFSQSSRRTIDKLNVEYESKEKEETIKQLELQNQLDKKTFQQRISLFIGGLITLLSLGFISILMLNSNKLKLAHQKDSIEQRLLRSQMNPHFIFNAISSIQNYLYDKNDLKVALTYMSKFADLMRQILENSREEKITLSSELSSLENYLELQQLRYSNSFGYEIVIDPELDIDNILVPPLITQPFVENAIEHGMIYRIENGKVLISIKSNEEKITLVIKDNGVGHKQLDLEPTTLFKKKTSLATTMTRERLDFISKINKQKFDLIIDKLQTGGTKVTIQLPKISAI